MTDQKRFDELDIMKGIGIILIVLGHLEPGTYLMRFIYSFHLFLFFACAGFVGKRYEDRTLGLIVLQNIRRLLIPYLFWCIFSQILDVATGTIDLIQACCNILFLNANVGWNAALWFLPSLLWTDNVCALIVKLKLWVQIAFAVVMTILWIIFAELNIALPFGLYTVPIAAIFWIIGYWINQYQIINW